MSVISQQDLARDPDGTLARVEAGEQLVVVRGGQPVAELRPVTPPRLTPRPFGLAAGAFVVPDDFDAPLPDDILGHFEGRCHISPRFPHSTATRSTESSSPRQSSTG